MLRQTSRCHAPVPCLPTSSTGDREERILILDLCIGIVNCVKVLTSRVMLLPVKVLTHQHATIEAKQHVQHAKSSVSQPTNLWKIEMTSRRSLWLAS
jgi:hypothetical protein